MRTKEQITSILAKRNLSSVLNESTWADLVDSISVFDADQKQSFVNLVANGNAKKVGELLKRSLHKNAQLRSRQAMEAMLSDDSLNLTEIDSIL